MSVAPTSSPSIIEGRVEDRAESAKATSTSACMAQFAVGFFLGLDLCQRISQSPGDSGLKHPFKRQSMQAQINKTATGAYSCRSLCPSLQFTHRYSPFRSAHSTCQHRNLRAWSLKRGIMDLWNMPSTFVVPQVSCQAFEVHSDGCEPDPGT